MWHQTVVRGSPTGVLPFYRLLRRLLRPDLTVYCDCSPETLRRRYQAKLSAAPEALTGNDRLVFAEPSGEQLERFRGGFERVIEETLNVVSISNDSSLDDLRASIQSILSELLDYPGWPCRGHRLGCVASMNA
jgi:thymidylate kinase